MKLNKGQELIEYALILILFIIVIVVILEILWSSSPKPPCDDPYPTAGKVVACIATRTAEARNR